MSPILPAEGQRYIYGVRDLSGEIRPATSAHAARVDAARINEKAREIGAEPTAKAVRCLRRAVYTYRPWEAVSP